MSNQNKMALKSPGQSLQIFEKTTNFCEILCTCFVCPCDRQDIRRQIKLDSGTMSSQNKMAWKSPGQSLQIVEKTTNFCDILCTCFACPCDRQDIRRKIKLDSGTMSNQNKMAWKSPGQSLQIVEKTTNLVTYCVLGFFVLAIARTSEKK